MTDWDEYREWLLSQGYVMPTQMPGGTYSALLVRPFNTRLVLGTIGDRTGLIDGWCYTTLDAAIVGLLDWEAHFDLPEPQGWFRHPGSGRRRARTEDERDEQGKLVPLGQEYVRR